MKAVPLAWRILPAIRKDAWLSYGRPLLEQLSILETVDVFGLAGRGLVSPEPFDEIRALGFHPILRLPKNGYWHPGGSRRWLALRAILPAAGTAYLGTGALFKKDAPPGTFIAFWEEPCDESWLLLTDPSPERCRSKKPEVIFFRDSVSIFDHRLRRYGNGWTHHSNSFGDRRHEPRQ